MFNGFSFVLSQSNYRQKYSMILVKVFLPIVCMILFILVEMPTISDISFQITQISIQAVDSDQIKSHQ